MKNLVEVHNVDPTVGHAVLSLWMPDNLAQGCSSTGQIFLSFCLFHEDRNAPNQRLMADFKPKHENHLEINLFTSLKLSANCLYF